MIQQNYENIIKKKPFVNTLPCEVNDLAAVHLLKAHNHAHQNTTP